MNSKKKPDLLVLHLEGECSSTNSDCGGMNGIEHVFEEVVSTNGSMCEPSKPGDTDDFVTQKAFGDPDTSQRPLRNITNQISLGSSPFQSKESAKEDITDDELKSKEVDRLLEELSQELDKLLDLPLSTSDSEEPNSSSDEKSLDKTFTCKTSSVSSMEQIFTPEQVHNRYPENVSNNSFDVISEPSSTSDVVQSSQNHVETRFQNIWEPPSTSQMDFTCVQLFEGGLRNSSESSSSLDVAQYFYKLPASRFKAVETESDETVSSTSDGQEEEDEGLLLIFQEEEEDEKEKEDEKAKVEEDEEKVEEDYEKGEEDYEKEEEDENEKEEEDYEKKEEYSEKVEEDEKEKEEDYDEKEKDYDEKEEVDDERKEEYEEKAEEDEKEKEEEDDEKEKEDEEEGEDGEEFVKPPKWMDPRSVPKLKITTNPTKPSPPDTFFGRLHQNSPLAYTGYEKEPLEKQEKDSPPASREEELLQAEEQEVKKPLAEREVKDSSPHNQISRSSNGKENQAPEEALEKNKTINSYFFEEQRNNKGTLEKALEKREIKEVNASETSKKENDSPKENASGIKVIKKLIQKMEELELKDSLSPSEVPHGQACPPVVKTISAEEKDSLQSYSKDSLPSHSKDSPFGRSKDTTPSKNTDYPISLRKDSHPSHSTDSLPSHSKDSLPSHRKDSLPSHSKEYLPSHSKDSLSSHNKDSSPSHNKDSLPSHNKDSFPSHGKDSLPSHSKDSLPSHSKDSLPSHSKDSLPSHSKDSLLKHSKDSLLSHNKDSLPLHGKDSLPSHNKDSLPSHGKDSLPSHSKDSLPSHSKDSLLSHSKDSLHSHNKNTPPSPNPTHNQNSLPLKEQQEEIIEQYDPEFPALITPQATEKLNANNLGMIRGIPTAKANHMTKWLYSQSVNGNEYEQKAMEFLPEYSLIQYSDDEEETEEQEEQNNSVSEPAENLDASKKGLLSLQLNEAIPECCLTDSVFLVDKPKSAVSQGYELPPMPFEEVFTVRDYLKIRVTHVYTPFQFWFNVVDRLFDTSDLLGIQYQMGNYYNDNNPGYCNALPRCLIKAGYICAIHLDYAWHRVKILTTPPPHVDSVSIYYLDFGFGVDVPAADLRFLPKIFGETPALAVRGTLSHIHPLGPHWSPDSMEQFQRLIIERELFAHIIELDLVERVVFLRISLNEEFVPSVNRMLVDANLAARSHHFELRQIRNNFGRRPRYLRERLPSHEMLETRVFPMLNEEFEVAFDSIIYSPSFEKFIVPRLKKGYDALHQALVAWMPAYRKQMEEWAALYNAAKAKVLVAQREAREAWLLREEKESKQERNRLTQKEEKLKGSKPKEGGTAEKEKDATQEEEESLNATEEEEDTLKATTEDEDTLKATKEEENILKATQEEEETPQVGSMEDVD